MPKSSEKSAKGSDEGNAMVAPASDASAVFVRGLRASSGAPASARRVLEMERKLERLKRRSEEVDSDQDATPRNRA